MANKVATKTSFTRENQPKQKGGQWFKTKLIAALKRQGLTENAFMDLLVEKAIAEGGVYLTELLRRYSPVPKQAHDPIVIKFPRNATPAQKASAVLAAMASGNVSADVGHIFIDAISKSLGIEEITELAKRLEALEAVINAKEA